MGFATETVYRLAQGLMGLLPLQKNSVVMCSYYGRGYSDSPKAIADALLASGEDVKIYWLVKSPAEARGLPQGVTPVSMYGLKKLYALKTAKVWVDNCRKLEHITKRRDQYYLQTWHGFALKQIEKDAGKSLEDSYVEDAVADSAQCDLYVSGSRFMSSIYRKSFWYNGPVLEYGTPRNDVFFHDGGVTGEKVRSFFGLPRDTRLALYAPTFRGDKRTDAYCIDPAALKAACEARFGGTWAVLIRLHPNVMSQSEGLFAYDGTACLDATAYHDMQELLVAADCLVTDYSSSMFDYALSGKPCFQFAPDIEAYKQDRNFYFDLADLPFTLARDNEALSAAIRGFDENAYHDRWDAFCREQGIMEDGNAASRCARWILNKFDS